jgi:hypothetical protein
MTARRHYRTTSLCTDSAGARLLVDGIGLQFDHVSTSLDALHAHDPEWWALGKLYAYREQTEPFVHVDSDVFLWQPLSPDPERVALLAQNAEYFSPGQSYYQPEVFEDAFTGSETGWLPVEWQWYRTSGRGQRGECCGVFGGNHLDFIRHYAGQAIRLIEERGNQDAWQRVQRKSWHNHEFEQYLLAACIEYHRGRADSPYRDIAISYVFGSTDDAFDPETAARAGYTHLIADAKCNRELAGRLEARVAKDYPEQYRRCIDYLKKRELDCDLGELNGAAARLRPADAGMSGGRRLFLVNNSYAVPE